jgi:hypothetical protein
MRETGLQLLDALQRLETVDRRFQQRSRICDRARIVKSERTHESVNGASARLSNGTANRT